MKCIRTALILCCTALSMAAFSVAPVFGDEDVTATPGAAEAHRDKGMQLLAEGKRLQAQEFMRCDGGNTTATIATNGKVLIVNGTTKDGYQYGMVTTREERFYFEISPTAVTIFEDGEQYEKATQAHAPQFGKAKNNMKGSDCIKTLVQAAPEPVRPNAGAPEPEMTIEPSQAASAAPTLDEALAKVKTIPLQMRGTCDGGKTKVYVRDVPGEMRVFTIVAPGGFIFHVVMFDEVSYFASEKDDTITAIADQEAFIAALKLRAPQFALSWSKPNFTGTDCKRIND